MAEVQLATSILATLCLCETCWTSGRGLHKCRLKHQPVGAGEKTKEKLKEILATGQLQRNIAMKQNEQLITRRLFCQVWGVGDVVAGEWWAMGYRSLEELLGHEGPALSTQQRAGLLYFNDIQQRIPREVCATI